MIKEKHEKGSDTVKEEPGSSDKELPIPSDVRIKKEDEPATSACPSIKKEPGRAVTKNGGVIGSTNAGSLQAAAGEGKPDEEKPDEGDALVLKQEECLEGALSPDAFLGPPHAAPPDGVQPLASNVISKQPGSMEVQYMQQQSQIFVFSTVLANTGADEVLHQRYPSIIAYHCAQPGTKKYLEKNPLKVTQFNRQNPAQWLNNLAMMKNKGCTRSPGLGPKNQPSIDNFLSGDGLDDIGLGDGDLPWDQKNNHHLDGLDGVANGLPDVGHDMDACSPSLSSVQPSLQGVKVPDENLTPQQRQHREEQLATIRKMQQMLFPENEMDGHGHVMSGNPSAIEMPQQMGGMHGGGCGGMPGPPEWMKMQQHNLKTVDSNRGMSLANARGIPGPRLQGPPPPYHQTPRSASVPIALQSPSPASPNNPTSNLSLPSPRASSALNSPADPNRQFGLGRHVSATGQSPTSQDSPSSAPQRLNHSNPGTPVSSHLSPSIINSANTEPTSTHQSSVDGMFGRTLQSMAQQKQMNTSTSCSTAPSSGGKEPNLMPVPSPQQIQYLNTFEGQELIIQKQPNTSLKDRNIISPPILPTTHDSGFSGSNNDLPHSRISGPNTPTSMDVGGPRFPPTPGVPSDGCRFQIPSPHTPNTQPGDKSRLTTGPGPNSAPGMSPQTAPGPPSDPLKNDLFPTPSPHMMDVPRFTTGPNASPKMAPNNNPPPTNYAMNVSPSSVAKPNNPLDINYGCARGDNVPLNPNPTINTKPSHFDPISSLAQMSQQLTNSVASSLNGQGGGGGPPPGMMNFGAPPMHMMDPCHGMPPDMDPMAMGMTMGPAPPPPHPGVGFHPNSPIRSLSPKLAGAFPNHMQMPRMINPRGGPNPYNGTNVQVKPNAPNTIQYLPAKPQQIGPPNNMRAPSIEFLQRFANPMDGGGGGKMPPQNMQYYPNNGPHMMGGHMGDGMDHGMMMMGNGGMNMGPMGPGMMPMMRGPPMHRPPMMRMPQMGFNGPNNEMFNPNQMFVGGPKKSPMGGGGGMGLAPDASQPLPPSMGQSNSFKNTQFVGPTTSDPNYAQQFHNFQQQLYATGTRNQMGGPGPGPPPGVHPHPHPQQQQQQPAYFNPK